MGGPGSGPRPGKGGRAKYGETKFHVKKTRTTVKARKTGTGSIFRVTTKNKITGKTQHRDAGSRVTQGRSYRGLKSGKGR